MMSQCASTMTTGAIWLLLMSIISFRPMVVAAVADAEPAGGARSDLKAPSGLDEVLDQLQGSPGAMAKLFGDDEADMGDGESAAGRKQNMPRAAGTASMAGSWGSGLELGLVDRRLPMFQARIGPSVADTFLAAGGDAAAGHQLVTPVREPPIITGSSSSSDHQQQQQQFGTQQLLPSAPGVWSSWLQNQAKNVNLTMTPMANANVTNISAEVGDSDTAVPSSSGDEAATTTTVSSGAAPPGGDDNADSKLPNCPPTSTSSSSTKSDTEDRLDTSSLSPHFEAPDESVTYASGTRCFHCGDVDSAGNVVDSCPPRGDYSVKDWVHKYKIRTWICPSGCLTVLGRNQQQNKEEKVARMCWHTAQRKLGKRVLADPSRKQDFLRCLYGGCNADVPSHLARSGAIAAGAGGAASAVLVISAVVSIFGGCC